jgi:hypothetical protein
VRTGSRLAAAAAALGLLLGGPVAAAQAAPSVGAGAPSLGQVQTHERGHGSEHLTLREQLGVAVVRASTAAYHNLGIAQARGYSILADTAGKTCIDEPGMGGMGVHYVNGDLVGDPAIRAWQPEAVVYAPTANGRLQLAAVEYVVIKSAWDATHSSAPSLFGHEFMVTDAPNRYGLPAFYSLHVWAWDHNPMGTFEMWNPDVVCP